MTLHKIVGANSLNRYSNFTQTSDRENPLQIFEVCKPWNVVQSTFSYGIIYKFLLCSQTVAAKKLRDGFVLKN